MTTEQLYSIFCKYPMISTDTRDIKKDSIFFALKGANFDGNKFSQEALNKGAAYVVVDDQKLSGKENHIVVDNVLESLQKLANYHRNQFDIPVIGITGTNGKTTTKELIAAVLQKKYQITFTQGNFNNHIGVPLTLLQIKKETEIAIIEMGANHPGEIAELCEIAEPNYGIITNIGKAHLEGFGSFEGVIKTKSELYDFLRKKGAPCFINADNELLIKQAIGLKQLSYGKNTSADLKGQAEESGYFLTVKALFPKGWLYLKSRLIGAYNFENILTAARVGLEFDVDPLAIQDSILKYQPTNNRSQLIEKKNKKIIMDAYNANPTSMEASLKNFFSINATHKTVILGDMLELGNDTQEEHQRIVDLLEAEKLDNIILVGGIFATTSTGIKTKKFEQVELLIDYLYQQKLLEDNLILIKGSRGIHLEKILKIL
ncbi:UDP-N-acetylmuramoyl-tripeptide--D-alanyl-D-alanine ligase [Sunxiuqinia sp. A32]|uniref:UDP-N-acetylmuramoyl-tripeptide--D-alanyl-D- alanine ligase n=1 Tax=Sunxiuqinia sp. A32 TaxID=3461496 RepID=UPI004045C03A